MAQIEEEFDFDQVLDFAQQRPNILLQNHQKKELSQKDQEFQQIKQSDWDPIVFNDHLPDFKKQGGRILKSSDIEILLQGNDNILDSDLGSRQAAIKQRLTRFQDALPTQVDIDDKFYVGRLIQYNEVANTLYFDCPEFTKPISFAGCQDYFVYSGQIIAAKFESVTVNELEVRELYKFDFKEECEEDNTNIHPANLKKQDAVQIVVAAGPFCYKDSTTYTPLMKLVEQIKQRLIQCDILLLLGPLVDQNNESLMSSDQDYQTIADELLTILLIELEGKQVLLVNSTSDANTYFPIPQPPLQFDTLYSKSQSKVLKAHQGDILTNIQYLSNPTRFRILDEIEVGVINADILQTIKKHSKTSLKQNQVMDVITAQFQAQQSFVPVYPTNFPVDQGRIDEELSLFDKGMPHIMICPSIIYPSIRQINNTIYINPGQLTSSSCHYAVITYHGNNSRAPHKNIRVDIESLYK